MLIDELGDDYLNPEGLDLKVITTEKYAQGSSQVVILKVVEMLNIDANGDITADIIGHLQQIDEESKNDGYYFKAMEKRHMPLGISLLSSVEVFKNEFFLAYAAINTLLKLPDLITMNQEDTLRSVLSYSAHITLIDNQVFL
ncbi:MAG: hypothetical protein Q9M91_08020 [Candidatus Dojkabacteria bacterium]|nr:hypothetical protein [Candidatus Dojkabacteria bacterium]MDQ7021730.1 hypothetical protein [Candidatus Dojkabacteria bacterium]